MKLLVTLKLSEFCDIFVTRNTVFLFFSLSCGQIDHFCKLLYRRVEEVSFTNQIYDMSSMVYLGSNPVPCGHYVCNYSLLLPSTFSS